jgi:hypothetical protein
MTADIIGLSNLHAGSSKPGWDAPVVPRNVGDAPADGSSAHVTPVLDGNVNSTFVNWTITQQGPYDMAEWGSSVGLDFEPLTSIQYVPEGNTPGFYHTVNDGPYTVRGGRHTLRSYADPENLVPETDEWDNKAYLQYVWSPLAMSWQEPRMRAGPPIPASDVHPNSDGLNFIRDGSHAWVTSIASFDENEDYDLILYDDYSNSWSGFSNELAHSRLPFDFTEFVVGHFSGTPVSLYPATVLYSGPGLSAYAADQSDARVRAGNLTTDPEINWLGQTVIEHRLADVYEAGLMSGVTYYFTVLRRSGSTDLLFELFPGTPGGIYVRGEGTGSTQLNDLLDVLTYTATETQWHPIVVFRDHGVGSDTPVMYDFYWSTTGLVDVPDVKLTERELTFRGAVPNPIIESGKFEFVLPATGEVKLDLYDVSGRHVGTLADGAYGAGRHALHWDTRGSDGSRLGAGIYWARLQAQGSTINRRVVVLR